MDMNGTESFNCWRSTHAFVATHHGCNPSPNLKKGESGVDSPLSAFEGFSSSSPAALVGAAADAISPLRAREPNESVRKRGATSSGRACSIITHNNTTETASDAAVSDRGTIAEHTATSHEFILRPPLSCGAYLIIGGSGVVIAPRPVTPALEILRTSGERHSSMPVVLSDSHRHVHHLGHRRRHRTFLSLSVVGELSPCTSALVVVATAAVTTIAAAAGEDAADVNGLFRDGSTSSGAAARPRLNQNMNVAMRIYQHPGLEAWRCPLAHDTPTLARMHCAQNSHNKHHAAGALQHQR